MLYVREIDASPIKFPVKLAHLGVRRALQTQPPADRACAESKADCGATERRDEIMTREDGGDSTPEGSSIPRALVI
jgi:hypothetical protein